MFYAYPLPHPISAHARNRVTRFEFCIFFHSFIHCRHGRSLCSCEPLVLNKKDAALDFLKHHGVIPSSVKCPRCGALCNFSKDRNLWRCGTKVIFRSF